MHFGATKGPMLEKLPAWEAETLPREYKTPLQRQFPTGIIVIKKLFVNSQVKLVVGSSGTKSTRCKTMDGPEVFLLNLLNY